MTPEQLHTARSTKLLIRADDFGASPGTNEAIIDGIDAGAIGNVGILAVGPQIHHCLDALKERSDQVCLGLHSALNSEWSTLRWGPAADAQRVSSLLAEDGHFFDSTQLTHDHGVLAEMEIEIEAQLKNLRALGIDPSYLDTHMGFRWLPNVDEMLQRLCQREGLIYADTDVLPKVEFADHTNWSTWSVDRLFDEIVKGPTSPRTWIFHPAYTDESTRGFGKQVYEARYREAKLLIHPDFVRVAAAHDCELARLDEVATSPQD